MYDSIQKKLKIFYLKFVLVYYPAVPRILHLFRDVDAYKKKDKEILCEADGWPPPLIKWKRNNVELKDGYG